MAESSPIPEQIEVAELLARKASGDLLAAQKLAPDPETNDDPIGFHAQQAVEKALKVGLTLQGADFPKTHDLDFLVTLSSKAGVEIQTGIGQAGQQTSDTTTQPLESLDRSRAVAVAELAVDWCHELLSKASA
jgi:HEPN domain-containing protein